MMSDLEKDLHYAMCESANISEAEADRILDAIMPTIKPLGYTHSGLTDAQREAVPQLRWAKPEGHTFEEMRENFIGSPIWECGDARLVWVNEGDLSLHDGTIQMFWNATTPPEPPKPERKMQRWEVTCCHWMDVKSLVAEGWEPYAVCPNVDEHPSHYLKRPIPGDAA